MPKTKFPKVLFVRMMPNSDGSWWINADSSVMGLAEDKTAEIATYQLVAVGPVSRKVTYLPKATKK